jgi:hypothetical protein
MITKEQYLEERIAKWLQFWNATLLLLAVALFLFLGIMDYFATPENFSKFIFYRTGISLTLLFLYYLNGLKANRRYQYTIISIMTILSAVTIEIMIMLFGGHISTYYAGMNLLIAGVLGLIPFNVPLTILLAGSIYGIIAVQIKKKRILAATRLLKS